ncbi:hypothetical protein Ari01nite_61430 [Paractinoplanes rishiriensis]|uniref:Uncharacterized protein n=1 Tax=Paractinoplanes rishiriensis TaxID=1050105 RepID=A0A919MXA1_9ACTN|nr:hypothetical protein Ari01nite_61430 [Actinoplanes rishiriensis]
MAAARHSAYGVRVAAMARPWEVGVAAAPRARSVEQQLGKSSGSGAFLSQLEPDPRTTVTPPWAS